MVEKKIGLIFLLLAIGGGRVEASPQTSADEDEAAVDTGTRPSKPPSANSAAMAVDPEEPARRGRQAVALSPAGESPPFSRNENAPDERPIRNPACGLMFELGIGGGGDDLVKVTLSNGETQTLSAGDGVTVSLGLMCTPIWVGNGLGIGVSGTFGYKGWSVGGSNGDIGLHRFPLTAAVHVLGRVAPRWLLLARGGIDKEADVSLSGSGVAAGTNVGLNANLGGFGEGGFYYILDTQEQRGAWSLTFRYTKLTYSANGASADGQSFMLFSTLYYNP